MSIEMLGINIELILNCILKYFKVFIFINILEIRKCFLKYNDFDIQTNEIKYNDIDIHTNAFEMTVNL